MADVGLVYMVRCLGCYPYSNPQAFRCNYTDIFVFSLVILFSVPNLMFPNLSARNVNCRRLTVDTRKVMYRMGEKSPYTKQCENIINQN
jgi:hypothetical protein